jgi:flagellar basal-body rod modification protein FlgD
VLGKDDFLKLLVTQLKYQDPMSPTDDKAFISELAQFSSLEQMQDLNENFKSLTALQSLSQMNFAVNLVGHRVVGTDSTGATVDGIVDNVNFNSGDPLVVVSSTEVNMKNIVKIY